MTDAVWQPGAGPEVARKRADMLQLARQFFASKEVLEVETPILSRYTVTDPNIESLSARSCLHTKLYLQTSPEYKMKRLLAAGFGDIFQICKVFRDSEFGRRHLPEFTLVEWYRLDYSLHEIANETIQFIATLLDRDDLLESAHHVSYRDAFVAALDLDPITASTAELRARSNADKALAKAIGEDRDAWLDLLLTEFVVSNFPADRLTVVDHYPVSQAALARRCPDNESLADRFEVFYGDLELANGFVELLDAEEQVARFERDRATRQRDHKADREIDMNLISALNAGLPDCSGVAVGFDRLLMLGQGETDLAAVTHFVC